MRRDETLKEIDSHISSLSSASHSKLAMPEVKKRRRQLHTWRAQAEVIRDDDPALDEILRQIYESDPIASSGHH